MNSVEELLQNKHIAELCWYEPMEALNTVNKVRTAHTKTIAKVVDCIDIQRNYYASFSLCHQKELTDYLLLDQFILVNYAFFYSINPGKL